MWMYKFYRSDSGARKFNGKLGLNKGQVFKKGSPSYYNCVHDAKKMGIDVTGDYVVRYYEPEKGVKNQNETVVENQNFVEYDTENEVFVADDEATIDAIDRDIEEAKREAARQQQEKKPKSTWGGRRPGAGRRGIDDGENRKKHSVYCSENELLAIKKLLMDMRATSRPDGED